MSKQYQLISDLRINGAVIKKIGDLCDIETGEQLNKEVLIADDKFPVYNGGIYPSGYYDEYNTEANSIAISQGGASAGFINFVKTRFWAGAHCYVIKNLSSQIMNRYLYHFLKNKQDVIKNAKHGAGIPGLRRDVIKNIQIQLPPLTVQQEIVRILDQYSELEEELEAKLEAERDARVKQNKYYKNYLLTFSNDEPMGTLGTVAVNLDSKRKPVTKGNREAGEFPYYGASGIVDYVSNYIFDGNFLLVSEDGANLVARVTPIAFSASGKIWVNNHAHVLQFKTYVERKFIEYYLNMTDLSRFISTAAQPKLTQDNLNKIPVPIPSFEEQERIVAVLDRFDALCNDLTNGLPAEIEARRKQYEYYRDKLLSFKELQA